MKYSIDRIEDGIAVCEGEDGIWKWIPCSFLWDGAREGDIFMRDGDVIISLPKETKAVRDKNVDLLNNLYEEDIN